MQKTASVVFPNGSQLAHEYEQLGHLFDLQPGMTRHFLDSQAGSILAALEGNAPRIRFQLPDLILLEAGESVAIPAGSRPRRVGGLFLRASRADRFQQVVQALTELEHSLNPALSICGRLLRYALARTLVYSLLPDGHPVDYRCEPGDDIPSIPVGSQQPGAVLSRTDAVAEEHGEAEDRQQVPFVDAARRFYVPQWVAFGDGDRLLAGSLGEAEATIASLRHAVGLLEEALDLCPGIVADPAYQRKRTGLLGQLINQGRALARAQADEIIAKIQHRAAAGSLNRGLSFSLTYFDDASLSLKTYPVEIIPNGRIMFIPAFVVRAMRLYEKKVRSDMLLTPSTRKHLLAEMTSIESAFNGHSTPQIVLPDPVKQ
jgi:hypothetical protein